VIIEQAHASAYPERCSLCDLCDLRVSVVLIVPKKLNHRDTENTEEAQRNWRHHSPRPGYDDVSLRAAQSGNSPVFDFCLR